MEANEQKNEFAPLEQNEPIFCKINYNCEDIAEEKINQANNNDLCYVFGLPHFLDLSISEPKMLLDPIITEGSLSMVHAYRGIGKTFFAMSIALAIAIGSKFLRWHADNPAKVLYVDGEMSAYSMQQRFNKLVPPLVITEKQKQNLENLFIFSADMQPFSFINIEVRHYQDMIDKIIDDNQIKFIILDNISSLTTMDELDSGAWLVVQNWLLSLRQRGVAVLLVHHSGKRGGQRGISKREDILDMVLSLQDYSKKKNNQSEEDSDEEDISFGGRCKLIFEKNRNIGDKKKCRNFDIELIDTDDNMLSWVDVYAEIKRLKRQGSSCREIEKITGISKSKVAEICKEES